jgi:hypothetical protein
MSFFSKLFGSKSKPTLKQNYVKELNTKYFRNLELIVEYDLAIDCYCDIFETWNNKPFESEITYLETHGNVKKILEDEYNEEICEMIKVGNYTEVEANEIIEKLDAQYLLYKKQCDHTKTLEDNLLEKFKNGEIE